MHVNFRTQKYAWNMFMLIALNCFTFPNKTYRIKHFILSSLLLSERCVFTQIANCLSIDIVTLVCPYFFLKSLSSLNFSIYWASSMSPLTKPIESSIFLLSSLSHFWRWVTTQIANCLFIDRVTLVCPCFSLKSISSLNLSSH